MQTIFETFNNVFAWFMEKYSIIWFYMRSREKLRKTREILCSQDNDPAGFKNVFLDNVIGRYALLMDI